MPDISMCKNKECTLKERCYRYRAVPSNIQSYTYFVFENGFCKYFMEVKDQKTATSHDCDAV